MIRLSEQIRPVTRLVLAVAGATLVLGTEQGEALAAEALIIGIVIAIRGVTRAWLRQARLLLPMLILLVVIGWFTLEPFTIIMTVARLMTLSAIFLVLFQTTATEDLGEALTRLGLPGAFAFILTSAFQFTPVLQRALADVRDAQRSRGIRLEGDLASLPNYPALLVPLMIHAFKLADDLAEALESRGYSRPNRTALDQARLGVIDYIGVAISLGLVALAFFV